MSDQSQALAPMGGSDGNRALSLVVAVIVIIAALLVGVHVRATAAEVEARQAAWQQADSAVAVVQSRFQAPTPRESSALLAESSRLSALGVADGEQLNVMGAIDRLAGEAALLNVRVSSVPVSGSVHQPPRRVAGVTIKPAGYEIAVEFEGSFAHAMRFVSSLPSSVAMNRLTASRRPGPPAYQVFLSVYQLDARPGN